MIFMMLSGVGFEMVLMGLSDWKDSDLGWDKEGQCIMICWMSIGEWWQNGHVLGSVLSM